MTRTRTIVVIAAVAVVIAVGITYAVTNGNSSSSQGEVAVFSRVQARTLQDTVNLTGTLSRKSIRDVDAAGGGIVNSVTSAAGDTTLTGQTMFSLGGRNAVAEPGSLPFFRSLVPGDSGPDVLELKQILAAAGDYPGPIDDNFTQQTQFALAQWQAQQGYPNSTPANPEAATVSLEEGAGYELGTQDSAPLVIGPPAAQNDAHRTGAGIAARADTLDGDVVPLNGVEVTIQSVATQVSQGMSAAFVITASSASSSPLTVNLTSGGTATGQDVVTPPTQAVLEAGATQTSVSVQTRVGSTVAPATVLTMSISAGTGYSVGSPATASTTIDNSNVPALSISGTTTVASGGAATLTVTANQAPVQTTQVQLEVAGSAQPGSAYDPVNPVVTFAPGQTSATVTIDTIAQSVIQPSTFIVVSIEPSPGSYTVTSQGTAVVTIAGSTAQPTVTLTSSTTYLQKGQPYAVSIGLSQAMSTPLTIQLSYGGSAVAGVDYNPPAGSIVVPADQTSTEVEIPTVTSDTVEADRTLTVSLAPSPSYAIGSPSSASVQITTAVVPTLTITGSTSAVSQGGAATFTITASQAPVKNTSVSFAVEGTAEPGQSYVPLPGAALLLAGQTHVTVTLQSLQTNITFEPTDMIVGSWPTRVGTVYVKAGATVAPGEPILSLVEPDLSVTLQASAADRTKLAVGQTATVQISGENNSGTGVITELDSGTTTVGAAQVYEGTIAVSDLTGADGSQVSITVVDQQINDALTVPIAAVSQNGSGQDVVRTVSLAQGGRVTPVPVTTGLTEGSYIQITGGLRLGQLVIVQVNPGS
jgi:Putative peptidoglycan binding domain/Calx-beta domain